MKTQTAHQKIMNALVKNLDFNEVHEYYEYIESSFANGQPKQARELYQDMPKTNQTDFLVNCTLSMKEVAFLTV